MNCWKIVIGGRVQGVGFRPFISQLANEMNLHGQVMNTKLGVTIEIAAVYHKVQLFIQYINSRAPKLAVITSIDIVQITTKKFNRFNIVASRSGKTTGLFITPDHAMCSLCKNEISHSNNRRFQYPFTTCLNCGPRFSIITDVPYDRKNTSMANLVMCAECMLEYTTPGNIREHAQTITCPNCSIAMHLWSHRKKVSDDVIEIIDLVAKALISDQVIAIKSLSGYLLCCNAHAAIAIQQLRKRKQRPFKPLAVMYGDIKDVRANYFLSDAESQMLCSEIAPIVVLQSKKNNLPVEVTMDLSSVGVFLPSTPLLQIILDKCDFPIIATSGNISNEPLCFDDRDAIEKLDKIADLVLSYDRQIVMPQDDSVVQFSPTHQQIIILRRSRGLAPECISEKTCPDKSIIAFGADLKNTIALQCRGNSYLSQYLGNLDQLAAQQRVKLIYNHLMRLLEMSPELLLADQHMGYHSTTLGQDLALENSLDIKLIQHHEAHFAAILEEHNLWTSNKTILGIVWDGTGLGSDNNIWGGEFFTWGDEQMKHIGQMRSVSVLAGDKMAKEPRLSALAYFSENTQSRDLLRFKFSDIEWVNYNILLEQSGPQTSSVGRMFDAIASILDLCDFNQFEGQAAMILEKVARENKVNSKVQPYHVGVDKNGIIDCVSIVNNIISDKINNIPVAAIAYKFHLTLAELILRVAMNHSIRNIAFSGGVFQNALLVDLIITRLNDGFELYFHEKMSPNDENISFGQLAHYNNISLGQG